MSSTAHNQTLPTRPSTQRPTLTSKPQVNGAPRLEAPIRPVIAKGSIRSKAPQTSYTDRRAPVGRGSPTPPACRRLPANTSLDNKLTAQSPSLPISSDRPPVRGNGEELKIRLLNLPPDWTTWDIYQELQQHGTLNRIEIAEPRRYDGFDAYVLFIPPPSTTTWIRLGLEVTNREGSKRHVHYQVVTSSFKKPHRPASPIDPDPEPIKLPTLRIDFGVMKAVDSMLVLYTAEPTTNIPFEVEVNVKRKVLDINFALPARMPPATVGGNSQRFKMRLNFPQLRQIFEIVSPETDQKLWILSVDEPPLVFGKTVNVKDTHKPDANLWTEWNTWLRQTEIEGSLRVSQRAVTQLQKDGAIVDIGRWLTYGLVFDKNAVDSPEFEEMRQALHDHSVMIDDHFTIQLESSKNEVLWSWLDNPNAMLKHADKSSTSSEMEQMAHETIHLPFEVRYQLEVCISHCLLHECNIAKDFLHKLATMDSRRAVKLLEKVFDEGERFYSPYDIFRRLLYKTNIVSKPVPWYCTMVRAATVTPTTIYYMPAMLETSNRVIRKYNQHEDRFLRVKFLGERYEGSIRSFGDKMDEVFTRIKRTMTNGISVAGRHYDFLAFGNSQFREHGAWFFAPIADLTVHKMREELGNFDHIKVIAKYCSRVGQCFSTTRATRWSVNEEKIPDIERNGFCFSDGVGKISPFLAQMIAQELGFRSSSNTVPSVFQFRREGLKGILAVDPALKAHTIQIRPSQEKFSGTSHRGLEIIRISQFSTAYLNVQIILVLSALRVADGVFVKKMRHMLIDLKEAMENQTKALELLCKYIDYNRMTVQLAQMICDGFMDVRDPFMISCLHLWRSWSLKYLKEKARIFVEQGAFVLGCIDETASLRGHFESKQDHDESKRDTASLPQIFLQIDPTNQGKWTVIKGVCILARNPSLHPGDIRVVEAVDVSALHHIRDCVVLPQTGDRDLANMCSGGDLDGDDYLVIWDESLLPQEWNHPPMDYTGPTPVTSESKVTVDDMTSFFVTHMKYDILRPIAVAHKYWADAQCDGVKDPICLELAQLHSMAVDFAKTGVPAVMPDRLRVRKWPHWSEPKNKPDKQIRFSKKVIGQLYDEVQRVPFQPAWRLPFDERILQAYNLDEQILADAREVKAQYDGAVRCNMAKFGIGNEFEIWTTFVIEHSDDLGDYKFAETIGEAVTALKEAYQKLCYEKAKTTDKERDWKKMGPFIAAMYTVTAQDVKAALEECNRKEVRGGEVKLVKEVNFQTMPFMSFPWLFPAELGRIANGDTGRMLSMPHTHASVKFQPANSVMDGLMGKGFVLGELKAVKMPITNPTTSDSSQQHDSSLMPNPSTAKELLVGGETPETSAPSSMTSSTVVQDCNNAIDLMDFSGIDDHEDYRDTYHGRSDSAAPQTT